MIKEYIIKGKGYFNCNVENPFDLNLQISDLQLSYGQIKTDDDWDEWLLNYNNGIIDKEIVKEGDNIKEVFKKYCDENNIELESVPKLLSKPLKEKLKYNAQELNFLKRTSRAKLPI